MGLAAQWYQLHRMHTLKIMIHVILLFIALLIVYVGAKFRAEKEAAMIGSAKADFPSNWHRIMWITGKAPLGIFALCWFVFSFTNLTSFIFAVILGGFTLMAFYWFIFSYHLSKYRGLDVYYISTHSKKNEIAWSERILIAVKKKYNLTNKQTHYRVKLGAFTLGFLLCVVLSIAQ